MKRTSSAEVLSRVSLVLHHFAENVAAVGFIVHVVCRCCELLWVLLVSSSRTLPCRSVQSSINQVQLCTHKFTIVHRMRTVCYI